MVDGPALFSDGATSALRLPAHRRSSPPEAAAGRSRQWLGAVRAPEYGPRVRASRQLVTGLLRPAVAVYVRCALLDPLQPFRWQLAPPAPAPGRPVRVPPRGERSARCGAGPALSVCEAGLVGVVRCALLEIALEVRLVDPLQVESALCADADAVFVHVPGKRLPVDQHDPARDPTNVVLRVGREVRRRDEDAVVARTRCLSSVTGRKRVLWWSVVGEVGVEPTRRLRGTGS